MFCHLIYSLGNTETALFKNALRFISISQVVTSSSMNIKPQLFIFFVGIVIDV